MKKTIKNTSIIKLLVFLYRHFRYCLFIKKSRKLKKQQRVNEIVSDYKDLIIEFELIQQKKSKLSRKQRESVCSQMIYLIQQGHIIVK